MSLQRSVPGGDVHPDPRWCAKSGGVCVVVCLTYESTDGKASKAASTAVVLVISAANPLSCYGLHNHVHHVNSE